MTRRTWGLRLEIVVSLGFLVAAAAGLMGVMVFQQCQREMVALRADMGLMLARTVEERLDTRRPDWDLPRLLSSLSASGFPSMVVLDRGGGMVASTGDWSEIQQPGRTELNLAMLSREVKIQTRGHTLFDWGREPMLSLAVPLFKDFALVGVLGLYSPLEQVSRTYARIERLIVVYLLLDTIVVVLFGAYLLNRRLVRPLSGLAGRFEELAEGRFKPLDPQQRRNDEIGRLEKAFERMATNLLDAQSRLRENLDSLQQAQEGLIRSEKMAAVGRLGAGLAHELGNPLASMVGFVHLLRDKDLPESDRIDFLNRMESEINRMDEIIRALLDFSRPSSEPIGPVDLNRVVEDGLALARVQKWMAGVALEVDPAPELPPVRGQGNRLLQVVLNLLENAGQAVRSQGRIAVSTGVRDGEVFVRVADTGPGIEPEDEARIFEPFFSRKPPGQGTGLGLSVSQSIVESLDGRIEVEGRPGIGAVFTVFLARIPQEADHGSG
jgi:signal transduction histidine kinase